MAYRPLPSHVHSGPDPALSFPGKSTGRPCVPGKLFEEPGTSGQPAARSLMMLARLSGPPQCFPASGFRAAPGVLPSLAALSGSDNDSHHGAHSDRFPSNTADASPME